MFSEPEMLSGVFVVTGFKKVSSPARTFPTITRDLDKQPDVEVAFGLGFPTRHAFALEAQFLSTLAPRRDFELHLATRCRYGNSCPGKGFSHGNRHVKEEIFSFALK
jgi:hypothetical protein